MPVSTEAVAEWVRFEELDSDPYPTFHRLLKEMPVAWIPSFDSVFVSRFEDARYLENHDEIFVPDRVGSLMEVSLGDNMLIKAGEEHARERAAINPNLRPRAIKEHWETIFRRNANVLIDELIQSGDNANIDLFAQAYAASNLGAIVGLPAVPWQDVQRWSRTFLDSVGNYAADPDVFVRKDIANAEADAAIRARIVELGGELDNSMLSGMLAAGLPEAAIISNVKLAIGGGMNEPQHVLTSGLWALAMHPDQRAVVLADPERFTDVFDETIRWLPPINMIVRRSLAPSTLNGLEIPADTVILALVGAANRDPLQFDHPDEFDIDRERLPHFGFGGGPHLCAGHWAARSEVVTAWQLLHERLPGLRVVDPQSERFTGFTFRGLTALHVAWDVEAARA